jgi:hypothetical protein
MSSKILTPPTLMDNAVYSGVTNSYTVGGPPTINNGILYKTLVDADVLSFNLDQSGGASMGLKLFSPLVCRLMVDPLPDADPTTLVIKNEPCVGSITGPNPTTGIITYEGIPTFQGTDTYTYCITDNCGVVQTVTQHICQNSTGFSTENYVNNTVYVDPVYGGPGALEDPTRPYLSLQTAIDAVANLSGHWTIILRPGDDDSETKTLYTGITLDTISSDIVIKGCSGNTRIDVATTDIAAGQTITVEDVEFISSDGSSTVLTHASNGTLKLVRCTGTVSSSDYRMIALGLASTATTTELILERCDFDFTTTSAGFRS